MATAPTDLAELAGGAAVDYRAHPILVVDDEPEILHTFQFNYRNDFSILVAGDAESALAVLQSTDVAVVVADHRMPGRSGVELLADARRLRPDALRIILTGYTDMETLVRGVNEGAIYRYVTKPWDSAELRVILRRAIETFATTRRRRVLAEQLEHEKERLEAENRYLRQREETGLRTIVGDGEAMRRVFTLIERVRDVPTPVLIEGETGTGKELVARAIHFGGAYRERLFVAQNCGALTESLLESELFGHRRGAFTGATSDKKGLFELAHEGTLFLDEVSETSPAFQVKLLRVLEDNEIRPLGDGRPRRVRVRIIAATNRRLADEVQAGRFRADLYYRLAVFPIAIPPWGGAPPPQPAAPRPHRGARAPLREPARRAPRPQGVGALSRRARAPRPLRLPGERPRARERDRAGGAALSGGRGHRRGAALRARRPHDDGGARRRRDARRAGRRLRARAHPRHARRLRREQERGGPPLRAHVPRAARQDAAARLRVSWPPGRRARPRRPGGWETTR